MASVSSSCVSSVLGVDSDYFPAGKDGRVRKEMGDSNGGASGAVYVESTLFTRFREYLEDRLSKSGQDAAA